MGKKILVATLLTALGMGAAQARGFDVSLSQKTAQMHYLFSISQLAQSGADASVGIFYNEMPFMGWETNAYVGQAKLLVAGNFKNMNQYFKLGAGAKVGFGKVDLGVRGADEPSVGFVALGLRLAYLIPSGAIPLSIYGEGFYAPEITSFGDTKTMREYTAGVEAEITTGAKVYVGYRGYHVKFDKADRYYPLDDRVHLGVVVSF